MKKIVQLENGRRKVVTEFPNPSRTQKQFKQMTDINDIMAKYQRGEAITHLNVRKGTYGDFSEIKDYRTSLDTVLSAQKAFMALPSGVRKRFRNDPQELVDFVSDPKNKNEALELGLINPSSASDVPATNAGVTMADGDKK